MPQKRWRTDTLQEPGGKPTKLSSSLSLPTSPHLISRNRDDYTIGIVCALPHEADAVLNVLDAKLPGLQALGKAPGDQNSYSFGLLGEYHVVVVHLGDMGPVEAAHAAGAMYQSFRAIQLCLVVGVCGIVPTISQDDQAIETMLGDVVISQSLKQYRMGRRHPQGFEVRETLGRPDRKLRNIMARLKTIDGRDEIAASLHGHLTTLLAKPTMSSFVRPAIETDHLFQPDYLHQHPPAQCDTCRLGELCNIATKMTCNELECDTRYVLPRDRMTAIKSILEHEPSSAALPQGRSPHNNRLLWPKIFFSMIGSGPEVMRSGSDRDQVASQEGLVAFEMEGAGVWDVFPTIVIKSACDYADSHKNKSWQRYAAATAAACAKAFVQLSHLPASKLVVPADEGGTISSDEDTSIQDMPTHEEICAWLTEVDYRTVQNDCLTKHEPGTSSWLFATDEVVRWLGSHSDMICCHAHNIRSQLIKHLLAGAKQDEIILYQYLSTSNRHNMVTYTANLLRQILEKQSSCPIDLLQAYSRSSTATTSLSQAEITTIIDLLILPFRQVTLIVDAVDEIDDQSRLDYMDMVNHIKGLCPRMRILFTTWDKDLGYIQIPGLKFVEVSARSEDLKIYFEQQLHKRAYVRHLMGQGRGLIKDVTCILIAKAKGMFLLASLHLELLDSKRPRTITELKNMAQDLSSILDKVYGEIWTQILAQNERDVKIAQQVLQWLGHSTQKLSLLTLQHIMFLSDKAFEDMPCRVSGEDLLPASVLTGPCKGLVHIDGVDGLVRFSHSTAKEWVIRFLQRPPPPDDLPLNMATCCLKILRCAAIDAMNFNPGSSTESEENKVAAYAMSSLGSYLSLADNEELQERILDCLADREFCDHIAARWLCMQNHRHFGGSIYVNGIDWPEVLVRGPPVASGLDIAVALNLKAVVLRLLSTGSSVDITANSAGWSALRWAIISRESDMCQILLDRGANELLADSKGLATVQWALGPPCQSHNICNNITASGDSWLHIGNRLEGFDITGTSNFFKSIPPIYTSEEVILLLIDHALRHTNRLAGIGERIMLIAASKQLGNIVARLIAGGILFTNNALEAVLMAPSCYTLVTNVVCTGNNRALFGHDIELYADEFSESIVRAGVAESEVEWVVDIIDGDLARETGIAGRTALSIASEMGYLSVAQRLISLGADVNAADVDGWTPLSWAVVRPRPQKIVVDSCVCTGNSRIVVGAAVRIRPPRASDNATTSVMEDDGLMAQRKCQMVRLLLANGASPHIRNYNSWSVFDQARWDNIPGILDTIQEFNLSPATALTSAVPSWYTDDTVPRGPHVSFTDLVTTGSSRVRLLGNVLGPLVADGNSRVELDSIDEAFSRLGLSAHIIKQIMSVFHISVHGLVATGNSRVYVGIETIRERANNDALLAENAN